MFSTSDLPTVVMYNMVYNTTCDVLNHLSIHYDYKLDIHFVMRTNSSGIEQ